MIGPVRPGESPRTAASSIDSVPQRAKLVGGTVIVGDKIQKNKVYIYCVQNSSSMTFKSHFFADVITLRSDH